jgi:hypothetical protein
MLLSSFNSTTRFLSLRSFAIIAFILSMALLTELYLSILNFLPISSRLSPLLSKIQATPGETDAEQPNPWGRSTLLDYCEKKIMKVKPGFRNEKTDWQAL